MKKAAENGNEMVLNYLALCYYYGKGTEKNLEEAFYWFKKAAERGYKDAMSIIKMEKEQKRT